MAAETVCRVWSRFLPISVTESLIFRRRPFTNALGLPCRHSFGFPSKSKSKSRILIVEYRVPSRILAAAGWFSGFGGKKKPDIVKAGDPVLHEPAADVPVADIGSQRIEEIIEDMIAAMRNSPGVGLAAPQIGVPLNVSSAFSDHSCIYFLHCHLYENLPSDSYTIVRYFS